MFENDIALAYTWADYKGRTGKGLEQYLMGYHVGLLFQPHKEANKVCHLTGTFTT